MTWIDVNAIIILVFIVCSVFCCSAHSVDTFPSCKQVRSTLIVHAVKFLVGIIFQWWLCGKWSGLRSLV